MSNITSEEVSAAVWDGDLFLEYLPIISLEEGSCVGAEALVRWRRAGRVVAPQEFIPIIENTAVSGLVTYWVIDTVAKELGIWLREHDGVHIAINVPPEVLGRGGLAYTAGKANLLDLASKFILEITERGLPDELGAQTLHSRARDCVLVALDDVCGNDAALAIAAGVRPDILKIEKEAVERITRGDLSANEMSRMSALIRSAKLAVIAEGVEGVAQVDTLRQCGINWAQGWLFSHPLPAAEFIEYFLRRARKTGGWPGGLRPSRQ